MNKIYIFFIIILFSFVGCSTRGKGVYRPYNQTSKTIYVQKKKSHIQKDKKHYIHPTMKPYIVRGVKYYPTIVKVGDIFNGIASWYGPSFHGKLTSSGEKYNMYSMTAAHKTLPINTIVRVTNKRNGLSAVVRINDRGPFVSNRIIDLSKSAAKKIDMLGKGTAPVKLEVLGFGTKGKKVIPTKKEMKKCMQKKEINDFALQIGSFSNINGALKTQEKYNNIDGYHTIIKDVESYNGRVFKVLLKGFKSEEEARDYKKLGYFKGAFIIRDR